VLLGGICECWGCASEWRTDPAVPRRGGRRNGKRSVRKMICTLMIMFGNWEEEETVRRGESQK